MLLASLVEHFAPSGVLFSGEPLSGKSYDRHVRQVTQVAAALQRDGQSWFYSPQWLAGQAVGTVDDLDSKAWALWTFVLSTARLTPAIGFNSFILFVICLAPFCIYRAARAFGLPPNTSLVAAWLGVLLWFFDSYLHWTWFVGSISWCGAACLSLTALAYFQRWLDTRGKTDALGCAGLMALALSFHAGSALTVLPALAASYLHNVGKLSLRERLVPPIIVGLALAPNAYWIGDLLRDRHLLTLAPAPPQGFPDQLLCDLIEVRCPTDASGDFGTRSGLRVLVLLCATAGIFLQRNRDESPSVVLRYGLAFCFTSAYLGYLLPAVRWLSPYQQLVPAILLTTLPAARFLREVASALGRFRAAPRLAGGLALALVGVLAKQFVFELAYFFPDAVPSPKAYTAGVQAPLSQYGYFWPDSKSAALRFRFPHRDGGVDAVARWLRVHARPGARVLVGNPTLAERLAWREGFEVLGGESTRWPLNGTLTRYAGVRRWFPSVANDAGRSDYLRAYAVEWVIADPRTFSAKTPALAQVAFVSGERIYRVRFSTPRVLQGGGQVIAAPNSLQIERSSPDTRLILAYRWHPALRCKPGCRIERAATDIDSTGFIAIPAPHAANLTVWNGYVR